MSIAADKAYYKEYNPMKIQKVAKVVLDMAKITAIEGKKVKIGEAEGLVKGFEKDDQGYEYVLLDMNDPYTYETLTYKVTIKALEKSTNN
jgi:FKBP-type peptidyl-prolyl cis-trans isomerase 2